jgi:hypothetical protein
MNVPSRQRELSDDIQFLQRSQFPKVLLTNYENHNAVLISRHLETPDFLVLADVAVMLGMKAWQVVAGDSSRETEKTLADSIHRISNHDFTSYLNPFSPQDTSE